MRHQNPLPDLIKFLKTHPVLDPNVTYVRHISGRPADYSDFPISVDERLKAAYRLRGITRLYSHQVAAWNNLQAGKNVVVVTPTDSGKTLSYNLPVLQMILGDQAAKALYLFPTKALSQDQVAELQEVVTTIGESIKVFTFDGDTPQDARQKIRKQGNIVVTNPDMLHQGILPHHTKWVQLFSNLKYIVIDEIHTYRGVFGSHVNNVLRRLQRICKFYGSSPQFICCSATIGNPKEHAEALTELPMALIDKNGAPASDKYFIFYNPPMVNKELGIRASYIKQTKELAGELLRQDVSTIVFALSRLNVEILTKYLRDQFVSNREQLAKPDSVVGYRGGYLPNRRRAIERGLRAGTIRGVVATNALELGIDIGSLEAVVLAGYPGTIASTWQQAGRAGRRGKTAIIILVGRSTPVDQFLINHTEYFFGRSPERARINPDNLTIMVEHIKCAAFELPFRQDETFGTQKATDTAQVLDYLKDGGVVHFDGQQWHWSSAVYPAVNVSLRRVEKGNFVVVEKDSENKIIAEVDFGNAPLVIYPDAIYMVGGEQFIVDELDWDGRKAIVRATDSDYYTDAISYTNVKILDEFESRHANRIDISLGEVQVMTRAVGFKKIKFYTMENVGYGDINLPDLEMHTSAYWFTIPQRILDDLPYSPADCIDGILGMANALHAVAAINLMCTVMDIQRSVGDKSAEWYIRNVYGQRGVYSSADGEFGDHKVDLQFSPDFQPTIFIYDNYQGGVGFSQQLFDLHETLLEQTRKLIEACSCEGGCPSCVGPSMEVGISSKQVALDILRVLSR
ncbi:MAG: DEAD/DEAH box helicase [Candidatus Marinimicrobia bacterium]|nr:DEAD/DEAH box helicase [Candidatus Neomarinimicrobiota bacterium]